MHVTGSAGPNPLIVEDVDAAIGCQNRGERNLTGGIERAEGGRRAAADRTKAHARIGIGGLISLASDEGQSVGVALPETFALRHSWKLDYRPKRHATSSSSS